MKTRMLVSASAAGLALALVSCAQMERTMGGPYTVTVTVSGCNPSQVTVNPDSLYVSASSSPQTIQWTINAGYDFPSANAITFKGPQLPPDGVFSPGNKPTNRAFAMTDNHRGPGSNGKFHYRITILKADGTSCTIKDPDVMNG